MSKATCDIPRSAQLSPDESVCFTAVVMALADLLVERDVFTREQLEIRAQEMIENPDMLSAADFVAAVAQRIFEKKFSAHLEKQKPDATGICPVLPTERRF